ncbi:MAG: hypothetical protein QXI73_04465 [Thermoproteota archaeon]
MVKATRGSGRTDVRRFSVICIYLLYALAKVFKTYSNKRWCKCLG